MKKDRIEIKRVSYVSFNGKNKDTCKKEYFALLIQLCQHEFITDPDFENKKAALNTAKAISKKLLIPIYDHDEQIIYSLKKPWSEYSRSFVKTKMKEK